MGGRNRVNSVTLLSFFMVDCSSNATEFHRNTYKLNEAGSDKGPIYSRFSRKGQDSVWFSMIGLAVSPREPSFRRGAESTRHIRLGKRNVAHVVFECREEGIDSTRVPTSGV